MQISERFDTMIFRSVKASISIIIGSAILSFPMLSSAGAIVNEGSSVKGLQDYSEYLNEKENAPYGVSVDIDISDFSTDDGMQAELVDIDGQTAVDTGDTGKISWDLNVELPGVYDVLVTYYNIPGKSGSVERALYLDGVIPFREARNIEFCRTWINEGDHKIYTPSGNEYRRPQIEERRWTSSLLKSSLGYRDESLKLYLSKGDHTLTFESVSEPMAVSNITLTTIKPLITYSELSGKYQEGEYPAAKEPILIEGEDAVRKSDPTLYAIEDRTSPINSPFDVKKILLNSIGGNSWRYRHQWIEWEIDVPEDALYTISLRVKQAYVSGAAASRRLYIDGEIPFAEAASFPVNYGLNWQMITLGDQDRDYEFYLTKGKHTIKLEAVIGDLTDILGDVSEVVNELNSLYRQIKMIVGSFPDPLRDYDLEKNIPDLFDRISSCIEELESIEERIVQAASIKGEQSRYIDQLVVQLKSMLQYPDTVPERINDLSDNINNLSSWLASASEVPLVIDYLYFAPIGTTLPQAEASFFYKLWSTMTGFFYSFIHDYFAIEGLNDDEQINSEVSLWLGIGRDQAMIIKNMADSTFTSQNNIGLKLKLVDMSILLQAVSSGTGPDAAIFMDQAQPLNYGIRDALVDLNCFPDIDEVLERFDDSAIEPFRFGNKIFGLPEQQMFPMLFYRTDILEEAGLEVPKTWDDIYRMIPVLQEQNMEIGLPSPAATTSGSQATSINAVFASLLLQNGASIYDQNRKYCTLDSIEAVRCFIKWSEFYNKYNFPKFYSDINRFRTGEMPVLINQYTFYNTLVLAAPEIQSLWAMAPVPGTLGSDGSIDRSVSSVGTACIIFQNASDPYDSWEFLKWWTSARTQIDYGREIEALQGASARWPTANKEAMNELGWSTNASRQIGEQWKYVVGIPEVPGGYYVGRSVDNAIKSVINTGEDARETILDQVDKINKEIRYKRMEFGLE